MVKKSNKRSDFIKYLDDKKIGNLPLRDLIYKLALYLSLVILIPLMFPTGRSFKYTDLKVGSIINKKVIAPFNFPVLKTETELAADREIATKQIPVYFEKDDSLTRSQIIHLHNLMNFIKSIPADYKPITITESDSADTLSIEEIMSNLSVEYDASLTINEFSQLLTLVHNSDSDSLTNVLVAEIENINTQNFIDINKDQIQRENIVIMDSRIEEDVQLSDLTDSLDWFTYLKNKFSTDNIIADNKYLASVDKILRKSPVCPLRSTVATSREYSF